VKFSRLAGYFERIESTTKRLEMFNILAELLSKTGAEDMDMIVYFCQEHLRPPFYDIDFGLSEKYLLRSIAEAAGASTDKVDSLYKDLGDLGLLAERLVRREGGLSVRQVYEEMTSIAETSGKGSTTTKIELVSNLLRGLSPMEARYATRFILGKLRLGIGDPTILEALAHVELCRSNNAPLFIIPQQSYKSVSERLEAFESIPKLASVLEEAEEETRLHYEGKKPSDKTFQNKLAETYFSILLRLRQSIREPLERAYNLCSDLGLVARTLKESGLDAIREMGIQVGYPIRMALCERLSSSREIIEKVGEIAVEAKYDGIRCQVHKEGGEVNIFSRNLERMTHMFPDVVSATKALPAKSVVFEGEALAHNEDTGELLPFQVTMKRRRKHGVSDKAKEFPIKFFAFELLYIDGKDYTGRPYSERHDALSSLIEKPSKSQNVIVPAQRFITSDPAEIDSHFEEYIETGLEGIIAKRLDAPYVAGSRNFNWIKLKRSYKGELADTVDVCIIGYFFGKGARVSGIGALLGAVYDTDTDTFRSISKIGTGLTDDDVKDYRKLLDAISLKQRPKGVESDIVPDVWVEPQYVVTVTADEITRSPNHTAGRDQSGMGYALRFPRAEGMPRPDKSARDATTVEEIISLSEMQSKTKVK
jgi:DNA ligase-1